AMGGDDAPRVVVEGACIAAKELGVEIILVGDKNSIEHELSKNNHKNLPIYIHHSSEVIGMHESPTNACKQKKDSSIMVAADLVNKGEADAIVSAGNTGAVMTAAFLTFGRLQGISRPALTILFPSDNKQCVFLDVGANVDCKAKHLLQFAIMGNVYAKHILNIEKPRVGVLSIGEEDSKGNELTLEASELISKTSLNFIGNVEGGDIVTGKADVVVCDGFVGNVVLKFGESLLEIFYSGLTREFSRRSIFRNFGALLAKPVVKDFLKRTDSSEYGCAQLLGVHGACFISHGKSSSKAIKNSIRTASEFVVHKVNKHIEEEIALMNGNGGIDSK
ncbi:MAG: phosphate acyltransferase PlsX, partial [Candidatus Firestonebacteria bacterium]